MNAEVRDGPLRITSFIHPARTFLPCSGVGRHMNNVLLQLQRDPNVDVRLLFSRQWLDGDGRLPANCPLRDLQFDTFPWPENPTERCWKLLGRPRMDAFVDPSTDWVYCPMDTLFPLRSGIRVAITLHDVHPFEPTLPWRTRWSHGWQRWKWGRWVRRAFDECAVVFTVSEFSKSRMIELLEAPAEKIVVVGNGVDDAFFAAGAAEEGVFPRIVPQPYVVMIGGLRAAKGGSPLLEVARALAAKGSDIQVVVAGPNDASLADEASGLPNVRLLGMVPDASLPGLLKHSLALLFLSLYEGFGMPPLEAMAVGTPAIVANRASLPEVVGQAGFVVEPSDPHSVVELCMRLLDDRAFRAAAVARGRARAATSTWERCAKTVAATLSRSVR